jgi:hypothetical protein
MLTDIKSKTEFYSTGRSDNALSSASTQDHLTASNSSNKSNLNNFNVKKSQSNKKLLSK